LIVRSAGADDAPAIVAYNLALALESEELALDADAVARGVAHVFMDPSRGRYLVAEADGVMIGQLMLTWEWSDWRDGTFWWIQSVYVAPEHRGQGVFKSLFQEVIRQSYESDDDVCGIRLYVERDNATAQRTYAQLGMHETAYRLMELVLDRSDES